MKTSPITLTRQAANWLLVIAAVGVMSACGGGGGSPGAVGGNGAGSTPGTGTTPGGTPVEKVQITIALQDSAGAAVTSLSGAQVATVKATVLNAAGAPAKGAIVTFAVSDVALIAFANQAVSALTDDKGVASINVKAASTVATGAATITASAVVETKTLTASTNVSVGPAPVTVGALAFTPAQTTVLPAFSTVTLSVPITSGGAAVNIVSGLTLSSLCVSDGSATMVAGSIANGVQLVTYTNNGCVRVHDTLTVSVGNSSQSIGLDVGAANIGSIKFVGSNVSDSIVLRGSGGLGRVEAAQLTFQVVDQQNKGLAGVDVAFEASTYTGGLTLAPVKGTTDGAGNVTTIVSSGTIPTPVVIRAKASRNGLDVTGQSSALTISTGLPIQKSMSLSVDKYNIEGDVYDGTIANVTVLMADSYGNPVSDNTVVNFITEGGAIGSSVKGGCNSLDGGCTVQLKSQNFRPTNGRVTILAYTQGLEDFVDLDGNGLYSCTNFKDPNGAVPAVYRPLVDTCVSGGEPFTDMSDPFLDTGFDGHYDPANGDLPVPFNSTTYHPAGDAKWGVNYIRQTAEIVFSGSDAYLERQVCNTNGTSCRDWVAGDGDPSLIVGVAGASCKAQSIIFRLHDRNNNPLPAGSSVTAIDATALVPKTVGPNAIPSTNAFGGTYHSLVIAPDTTKDEECASGGFSIKITTPKGVGTLYSFKSQ